MIKIVDGWELLPTDDSDALLLIELQPREELQLNKN